MLADSEVLSSDSPFIIAYGVSHPWLLADVPYVYLRDLPLRLSVTLLSGDGLRAGPIIKWLTLPKLDKKKTEKFLNRRTKSPAIVTTSVVTRPLVASYSQRAQIIWYISQGSGTPALGVWSLVAFAAYPAPTLICELAVLERTGQRA